jgi:hypothetical protein
MTTAVTSPILVILMSPKVDTFPAHTFTSAKCDHTATMGTNGFVRCGIGSRDRLLVCGVLGNFHCWATFIPAILLFALLYLTRFTAVCHWSLPTLGIHGDSGQYTDLLPGTAVSRAGSIPVRRKQRPLHGRLLSREQAKTQAVRPEPISLYRKQPRYRDTSCVSVPVQKRGAAGR